MLIRNEKLEDYRKVEELIRKTFWNLFVPGCSEHYFAHLVRKNPDYIPELDFVLVEHNKIIGHIIYVKAKLVSDDGTIKNILSFGPFTIDPDYQRKGYGRKLLDYSLEAAKTLGYDTVAIYGNPENYICYGFKNCKRYNICLDENVYPVSLLIKTLKNNCLEGKNWKYIESSAHNPDMSGFDKFDSTFECRKKEYNKSQELFYIYSRSNVVR